MQNQMMAAIVQTTPQYDVEAYQRLEALLQHKLPEYSTDEETVLVLLGRVNEAQRLAARELRELQAQDPQLQRKKKRKEGEDGRGGGGMVSSNLKESARPNQRGSDKSTKVKRHKQKH